MRKRPFRFLVSLTPEENLHLQNQVKISGLKREQFLRKLIMGVTIRPRPPNEYADLLRQLSGIATNINQMAKVANSAGYVSREQMQEIHSLQNQIWDKVKGL